MSMQLRVKLTVAIAASVVATTLAGRTEDRSEGVRVYHNFRLWPGAGGPIDDAVLVVEDGEVVAARARASVEVPEGAERIDLGGANVIPGLVIAETSLAEQGRDDERAITPEVRAIDGFDPYRDYTKLLAGGVTTVQLSPGTRRLLPGRGAVVKLAGADLTLRPVEGLRVVLGDASKNPPRIFEAPIPATSEENPLRPSRAQLPSSRAGAVAALRAVFEAAREYRRNLDEDSQRDLALDAVAGYLNRDRSVRFTAPEAVDVLVAMHLAEAFGLRVTLVDPREAHQFQDQFSDWAKTGCGVILNAAVRPGRVWDEPVPDPDEPKRPAPWEVARDLLDAGVPVALRPADDADLDDMLFVGGVFTRAGLAPEKVLAMLTSGPAEILGVADRVGTLAPGHDADFVVLSDAPFATHCTVQQVFVGGRLAYQADATNAFTLVRAGRLYTGSGESIQGGAVLVEGSKIRAVGADVSAPSDATLARYDDAVIVPGMIDLGTQLGLGGPVSGTVNLQTKLGELLVSHDPSVAVARQGGVTTALLVPTGNGPVPVVALKLSDLPRVVSDPAGIKFTVGGDLTARVAALRRTLRQGKSYADAWTKYEKDLTEYEKKRKEYEAAKAKAEAAKKKQEEKDRKDEAEKDGAKGESDKDAPEGSKEGDEGGGTDESKGDKEKDGNEQKEGSDDKGDDSDKKDEKPTETKLPPEPKAPTKPKENAGLEPYRPLFADKIPVFVEAVRADAIDAAAKLFRDEFDLRTVLLQADDAFREAGVLSEKSISVAVGPEMVREVDGTEVNLAQVLATRGAAFGFRSGGTTGSKYLPLAVTYAVRQGLGTEDALRGLTAAPAEMLGVSDSIGTLAAGRDADLVVLSGPPFELSSRVLAVMIDGKWVYESEEDD